MSKTGGPAPVVGESGADPLTFRSSPSKMKYLNKHNTEQMKGRNGHYPEQRGEVLGITYDEIQQHDAFAFGAPQNESGDSALFEEELAGKAKEQPQAHDQGRVHQMMCEFEIASARIQATIAERVRTLLDARFRQEILGILEEALVDGTESLEASTLKDGLGTTQLTKPSMGGAVRRSNDIFEDYELLSEPVPSPVPEEQEANMTPGSRDMLEKPRSKPVDQIYHGTVKLHVEASDSLQQVAQFMDELRQNSDIRVLQMVGNYKQGVGIWLVLRTPMSLEEHLLGMDGVSAVEANGQHQENGLESLLKVRLEEVAPVQ